MKSFTSGKSIFGALALCALVGVTAAQAQEYSVRATVPFQFMAGEKVYPAGDYQFTVDSAVHILKIRPQANTAFAMLPLTAGSERRSGPALDKGMVRFTNTDGVHVLNGVWRPGASDGNVPYPSKAAKGALASSGNTGEASRSNLDAR